jgi:EAL domain-containing protein (putative c-di-GMP-specific phosphodiesterase class I)
MTASVGVVNFDPGMDVVDTLASVGRACAEAKANGRNCVVRLNEGDSRLRAHLEEMRVVADLKRKVNPDRYFLHFQPVVSLSAPHSTLNYEVLLRMRDEQGGIIPPGRFIGAAERNGLMSDIDRWVLRSIMEWLDDHPEHLSRIGFTTVNISGASLNDSRFIDDAFAMFSEFPGPMRKLCFEITESVALTEIQTTRRFIDRIRDYGGKLALDDFGAGYTSFNYLKEIPADFIKIDGIFVRDINLNPANFAITRTIVDLTHELGMQSIAEWAETPDTVATLVSLGVDYGQGFGLARPMDKEAVTQALSCADLVKDEAVLAIMNRPPRAVSRIST